ncbi:ATP-binding cassette domain-containing protein [Candidatus Bathyarchaeota archaeon]|nr:MAG: ATP-binding cassette domain-containing protein [Candidatus Bathyarchaeota archaeon]
MVKAIIVNNLVKNYGSLNALDRINFQVEEGSVFGLLGPNGAGKTTTIRILTGLTRPTSGSAVVLGYDIINEAVKAKQQIGVVPDTSNIYEELTAYQNLIFAAQLYNVPRGLRKQRAHELLESFGLSERAEDKVAKLSHGLKRRLTIACALVHSPSLLFLDEPTTGLDVQSARQLRSTVKTLGDEGVTVFLTTHYIEEADQLCDKVAMINHGSIAVVDSPEKLKASITGSKVTEVSFTGEPKLEELRELPGVFEVYRLGNRIKLTTGSDEEIIGALVDYGREKGIKILSMNTLKPTLEDAFIRITGSSPKPAGENERVRGEKNDV